MNSWHVADCQPADKNTKTNAKQTNISLTRNLRKNFHVLSTAHWLSSFMAFPSSSFFDEDVDDPYQNTRQDDGGWFWIKTDESRIGFRQMNSQETIRGYEKRLNNSSLTKSYFCFLCGSVGECFVKSFMEVYSTWKEIIWNYLRRTSTLIDSHLSGSLSNPEMDRTMFHSSKFCKMFFI